MADRSKRTETAGKREKLVKQERKNREQQGEKKEKHGRLEKQEKRALFIKSAAPASTSIFPMRNSWLRSGRCWKRFWLEAVRLKR